jgi:triacylglycerol lipase
MSSSPALPSAPTGTRHLIAPELLPGLEFLPEFDLNDEFIAALRQGLIPMGNVVAPPTLPPALEAVSCQDLRIPGPADAPEVRVLVYTAPPVGLAPRPAYLYIHGGGYVLGSADMMDVASRQMAVDLGCVVVSVDYRLAPETRWPGAVEDCYAALRWMNENAATLGIDTARIAVGGESAGGGHAAALALLARDRGEYAICFQMLDCPMLDDRTGSTHDPHPYCGEFVWTPEKNRYGWRALLGGEPGSSDVPAAAVPARAESLAGLPPAIVLVGSLDLFLEEDMDYARRLLRTGVPAELHVIPGGYHGFGIAGAGAPQVELVHRLRNAALARAFAA